MSSEHQTSTTQEAADMIGRAVITLQRWVRDGQVAPETTGGGRQKRIIWRDKDIEAGRMLAAGTGPELTRLGQEMLGALLGHLQAGRVRADVASEGYVIVITASGPRVFHGSDSLATCRRRCGSGSILIVGAAEDSQI